MVASDVPARTRATPTGNAVWPCRSTAATALVARDAQPLRSTHDVEAGARPLRGARHDALSQDENPHCKGRGVVRCRTARSPHRLAAAHRVRGGRCPRGTPSAARSPARPKAPPPTPYPAPTWGHQPVPCAARTCPAHAATARALAVELPQELRLHPDPLRLIAFGRGALCGPKTGRNPRPKPPRPFDSGRYLEREKGFEPSTPSLGSLCSTN